ncbi:Phosphate regulon sensor protein PhoR (SphS) [Minicystis rosea]|nr:Phosphate regulon sensor protein PhoR (SphS) [Minicystis rosea]
MRRILSRLTIRIYLAGLLQFAVVLLGFLLLLRIRAAADAEHEREARAAVDAVAAKLGDDEAVRRELDRVGRELGASLTIHDDHGRVLVTNRREGDPPPGPRAPGTSIFDFGALRGPPPHRDPPPFHGPPLDPPGAHGPPPEPHGPGAPHGPPPGLRGPPPRDAMPAYLMPVRLPDGSEGHAFYALRDTPSPRRDAFWIVAIVIVGVGVVSWVLSRSLARPLGRLSDAARAFGGGKLDARARLARADEIGDVAAAFDEMAERITTLLRAEKELLANVSHELRTPLSRIRVALEIAEEGDAETARAALHDIAQDLSELERLISDVLTAARLDLDEGPVGSGIPPLRREHIEVSGMLEHAAAKFRTAHPKRTLVVTLAPDLPEIDGDPVLLRRVVDNLLENARKYSARDEGEIELHASVEEAMVHIEVRDRGIGIRPEDLPHVFRPFFRADRSRTRKTGGFGLGLALARRIVEAHEGTIALESTVGEGTRAIVRLPAASRNNR